MKEREIQFAGRRPGVEERVAVDATVRVQLLTFPGCPNAEAAREVLRSALASSRIRATVEEADTTSPNTPEPLRGWGSPTILINGMDIEGLAVPSNTGCRLYRDASGRLGGTPPEETILGALRERLNRAVPKVDSTDSTSG